MAILRFFASARERAGVEFIEVPLDRPVSVRDFLELAEQRTGASASVFLTLGGHLFAVNQSMGGPDTTVNDGDEVAVLPPLSGGA
ncbi:MAG: MoaD/ThiS family protein [Candidatus Nitrospinota bacterium M3_3B_026]